MWSDTLMQAERMLTLQGLLWGAASALAGTALVLMLTVRPRGTVLLLSFGALLALIGLVEAGAAITWLRLLHPRDIAGAERLTAALWFLAGFAAGLTMLGLAITGVGVARPRRNTLMGGGVAVVIHGLALLLLVLRSLTHIAMLRIA